MEVGGLRAATLTDKSSLGHDRASLPWIEKYRPSHLDEIIAHDEIISTIRNLIQQNKLPHLLFYGPAGTGKTTTALACARMLYGAKFQNYVMELNASDERGIDVVRHHIKDFASTKQIFSSVPFKMIILDEADQMTGDAQAALRRVIEQYTRNVRFCILCNHINKVVPALQSRCTRFRFGPLKKEQVKTRLQFIAQSEKLDYTDAGLEAIYKLSCGDMRKCLNTMQATNNSFGNVHDESVYSCTGQPSPKDIRAMVEAMVGRPFTDALEAVRTIRQAKGLSLTDILGELVPYVTKMAFPDDVKIFLFEKLADLEYNLAFAASDKIELSAMVGAFQIAKEATARSVPVQSLLC
eukprot:TRINITY_DN7293_c0_g1_i1.p1 TRINITY_DN7293_c0_g1~~TRINITY_DN7293_c0_g1_i1.p1  ORF type:complete len:379 (-),score=48.28 TRINITY_DN7293_c0_g1_i1:295-1350(-)